MSGGLPFGPLQHAEQITRIIGIGDHIQILIEITILQLVVHIAQGGKILDRETDAVKQGDLPIRRAALGGAVDHLPDLGHGVIGVQLLDFALDPGLFGEFDKGLTQIT